MPRVCDEPVGAGFARDKFGVSDCKGGRVFALKPGGTAPALLLDGFQSAADLAFDDSGALLLPDMRGGTLTRATVD